MTFVKVNGKRYPAEVFGRTQDEAWDNRESRAITLEMDYETAKKVFVNGISWSIVQEVHVPVYDNNVQIGTELAEREYDNSEFGVAGDIIDHRDGTVTVKMGKLTPLEETLNIMLGGD